MKPKQIFLYLKNSAENATECSWMLLNAIEFHKNTYVILYLSLTWTSNHSLFTLNAAECLIQNSNYIIISPFSFSKGLGGNGNSHPANMLHSETPGTSSNMRAALRGVEYIAQHIKNQDKDNEVSWTINKSGPEFLLLGSFLNAWSHVGKT